MHDIIEHDLRYYLRYEKRKWRTDLLLVAAAMFTALTFAALVGGISIWIFFAVLAAGFLVSALIHWYRTDPSQELKRIRDPDLFCQEGASDVNGAGVRTSSHLGGGMRLAVAIRQRISRGDAYGLLGLAAAFTLAVIIVTSGSGSVSNSSPGTTPGSGPAYNYPTDYPGTHP